jgi:membrane protein YdbS with pleckstrin-like domain
MIDIASDERIILTLRRHWFVLLMESLGSIFLFILPFVLLAIFTSATVQRTMGILQLPAISTKTISFLSAFWLLFIWFRLYSTWTSYYLDKWVITNKRIVTINQVGFFNRDVSSFKMDKIQDIETKVEGLLETFIDYGDITIQTAGEAADFKMHDVPSPAKLKEVITHQQDVATKETGGEKSV